MLEKQAFVPGTAAVAPAHVRSGNVLAWQTLLMLLPCCYCAFSKQHVRLKRHALMQEAGVQAYFAGHDHNLEHIHASNSTPHYIISGGGSKSDRPFIGVTDSLFQWPYSGFVTAELSKDELTVYFYGYGTGADDLEPMYSVSIAV